ncbi:MAG TPA: vWA domain-containing protein [Candidatus Wallbacteria bacterium]|nr:vWA domain-containing protein [Candidatus Wallbacteria bacterium]
MFLFLSCFICSAQNAAPEAGDGKIITLDIVLLIDQSGSMRGSDPKKLRSDASRLFVNLCSETDRVAVVGFGNDAVQIYPPMQKNETGVTRTPLEPCKNPVKLKIIEAIKKNIKDNENHTSIHRALEEALAILKFNNSLGKSETIPIVVMLTDGQIKGSGDLPPSTSIEKANASIDNSLEELGRNGVRIMTIGLGEKYDAELLRKISNETNGSMYETKNPALLVDAYRKIFLDISDRFMYINSMKGDLLKFSYPVSLNEKDAVILVANKSAVAADNFVTQKSLTLNDQKIMSLFEDKSILYDFSRVFNPAKGKLAIDYKFNSNIDFDLFLIKNMAMHINLLEPKMSSVDYYETDTMPIKIQLYRIDGISMARTKFKIQLSITAPDGSQETIELERNNDIFTGEFVPRMPGLYYMNFATRLLEESYEFENVKQFTVSVLPKSALTVKIKEPSTGLFKYTAGSSLRVAAEVLVDGYAAPDDLKNLIVTASVSSNVRVVDEINLDKKSSDKLYQGKLTLKTPGKMRLKMSATADKCKATAAEFDIDVISEPTLNITSPINNTLYKPNGFEIKVKLDGVNYGVQKEFTISANLINKSGSGEVALKFKKDQDEPGSYISDQLPKSEGIYELVASTTFLDKTIMSAPVTFFVYNIDSPVLGVTPGSASARKPLLVSAKLIESGNKGNYGVKVNCEVVKPRKSKTSKEQIIKLVLKDDGKNGDKKAGDSVYSSLFDETATLGTYEFRGRAYYADLQIPEEYKSYNAVNTVKAGISYYIEVEEAKRGESDTGKTYFEMDTLKNDAGCSGSGRFALNVKVTKAKRYSITFKTPNTADIDIYYSESGKEPSHEFSDKLNEINNSYIFTYEVKKGDRNISVPIEILLHDEEGKLKDASEKIYIKGETYVPMSPWSIIILLALVFMLARRYFTLTKQEFQYEIKIFDKSDSLITNVKNSKIVKNIKIPFTKIINLAGSDKLEFAFSLDIEKLKKHEESAVKILPAAGHFKVFCIDYDENKWQIKMNKKFDDLVEGEKWYKKPSTDKESLSLTSKITVEEGLEIYTNEFIIKFNK